MFYLSCDRNRFPAVAKNQKGEDVTFDLYYRRPTTEEIISYNSRLFQKKNGKVLNNVNRRMAVLRVWNLIPTP